MKILYAVSEAYPFAKNGGLGDVASAFPQQIKKMGHDIRVIMPLYDVIPEEYQQKMEPVANFMLNLSYQPLYCGLFRLEHKGVEIYFVENDIYFRRGRIYGCKDDSARFAFFAKAVCESIRYMDWIPDVVHCNDWQTALILFYLRDGKLRHPDRKPIKTVFTIHNVEYQGDFSYYTLTDVFGLSGTLFAQGTLELDGNVNLMKGAVEIADCVTTVSPSYAEQLTNASATGAISDAIARKGIRGIRNGLHEVMNPFDSELVHRPYDRDSVVEKVYNKMWMQERHGLHVGDEIPVFGILSRLMQRKGFDLVMEVMPEILGKGAELVVTGDGDKGIYAALEGLKQQFPGQVDIQPFSEENSAELFSSIDIFLMPSEIEPCGTSQLQAMRYGAVPVVHLTGGLKDTVKPYDEAHPDGYGFGFVDYTAEAFRGAIEDALEAYHQAETWEQLQMRCMEQKFTWEAPAQAYISIYRELTEKA